MVRGYISSNYTLDKWDIASSVRVAIALRLREQNIAIAVPARIIMHKDSNGGDYRPAGYEPGAADRTPSDRKE